MNEDLQRFTFHNEFIVLICIHNILLGCIQYKIIIVK